MIRSHIPMARFVAWALLACSVAELAAAVADTPSAAAAPHAPAGTCAPQLTEAGWLGPQGSASAQIQVTWQWSSPPDGSATLRVLVTDEANPDPATNHALDPRALPASAGSGDTLNWYPTTAHLAQLVVSHPGGACDGAVSEGARVTFGGTPPVPSPVGSPVSQPRVLSISAQSPTPPAPAGGGSTGSGSACMGPLCAPSFPDLGQVISSAIVSGLTTLLADMINAVSRLIQGIITWATAGSLCTTTGNTSSTFTLLSSTPPCLTWTNPYVQTYATLCRSIALALVALLLCLHGLEIALATRAGHTFEGPLDALRRVALAAVLGSVLIGTNGSDGLFGAVLSVANAMTAAVGSGPPPAAPATTPDAALQDALVGLVYLVMELILIVQLLVRLALLDLLLVIAPLAVLCYAYPRWAHWATHWAQITASTILLQFLQVTALQVSARMVAGLDVSSASAASATLLETLLGIAGLLLVVRLPRLLYGLSSGVLGGALPIALGWGGSSTGGTAPPEASPGTTTVTPDDSAPRLASGGPSGSAAALPPALPHGGSGAWGPLSPGGPSGSAASLVPAGGASAVPVGLSGGLTPTDEEEATWGSVVITEVPPPQLPSAAPQSDGPAPPLLPAADSPAPPGGWP